MWFNDRFWSMIPDRGFSSHEASHCDWGGVPNSAWGGVGWVGVGVGLGGGGLGTSSA